jgi:hypothetical protein
MILSTQGFGMIFMLDMEIIIVRHTFRFYGGLIPSKGTCVIICSVLSKLHIRLIEAPKATAMKAFATIPPVKEESTRVKAFSTVLINAIGSISD